MEKRKPINVSLRVIADLSQGLYRSPADALKEIVSNAYDADSPTVEINFSKDFSSVTIRDQGKGMIIDKFVQIMETIGGSSKRSADDESDTTQSKRKIVGRIGIGLLSVSQIANKLELQSTVEGSTEGFHAEIEFDQFASENARKIKITDLWEEEKPIEIGHYGIRPITGVEKAAHFTTLKLSKIKRIISDKLNSSNEIEGQQRQLGKTIFNVKDFVTWIRKNNITKTALHEYDKIFWELCTLCPVPYMDNALTINYELPNKTSSTDEFLAFAKEINAETHLSLKYDGIECYKPLLLPDSLDENYPLFFNLLFMKGLNNREITFKDYDENEDAVIGKLKVRGYIYFQRPRVWPPEFEGLLIRVRNVAVGQYDSTFLTYRRNEGFKFNQITGEIYVDGLDEALNIDRSSFRETEPAFAAFRDAIHTYLSEVVFPGIKEFASLERTERVDKKVSEERTLLKTNFKKIDPKQRKLLILENEKELITRTPTNITLSNKYKGKRLNFNKEFQRIIIFLESKLSSKFSDKERDKLYEQLINWLNSFEE